MHLSNPWLQADIGLAPTAFRERHFDLMLEVRHANAPPFAEYNPNEMMIHVQLWDREKEAPGETTLSVVVPGEQSATVGDLRAAVATAFDLAGPDDGPASGFWLVCPTAGSSKLDVLVLGGEYDNVAAGEGEGDSGDAAEELHANSLQQLRRDHKVWSGEKFYLELGDSNGGPDGENDSGSACAQHYEREAYFVTVVFNALDTPGEFEHTLAVDLRSTVLEVKTKIAEVLVRHRYQQPTS